MDPPVEKADGPEELPADELSNTTEWYQNASAENVEPAEPTDEMLRAVAPARETAIHDPAIERQQSPPLRKLEMMKSSRLTFVPSSSK